MITQHKLRRESRPAPPFGKGRLGGILYFAKNIRRDKLIREINFIFMPKKPNKIESLEIERPVPAQEQSSITLRQMKIAQIDNELQILESDGEATGEEAADIENRRRELQNEKKINEYLIENLPDTEERIAEPMDSRCEVSVVIPVYGERDWIFRPLESLANQKGVKPDQYEVIFVINNPPEEPEKKAGETEADYKRKLELYRQSAGANGENAQVLKIINYINEGGAEPELNQYEKKVIEEIKKKGIKIFAIDKSSPGRTLPEQDANVGGARNRGVAEAAARFYEQKKENGIIAQTDSDTKVDEHYIKNLIKVFKERPELVGLKGELEFQIIEPKDALFRISKIYEEIGYKHRELLHFSTQADANEVEQNDKIVNFSGANMASRAYEAAIVGGVPKLGGGEDPAFGKRLSAIGEIDKVLEVKVITAERRSARTAVWAGHGQEIIRQQEKVKAGDLTIDSKDKILFGKRVEEGVRKLFETGEITAENLEQLVSVDGRPLLSNRDAKLFADRLKGYSNLDQFSVVPRDSELAAVEGRLRLEIDKRLPPIPVEQAVSNIIKSLNVDKKLEKNFNTIFQQMSKEENDWVEKRIKILNNLIDIIYGNKVGVLDDNKLIEIIAANKKQLGFGDEEIKKIGEDREAIMQLVKIFNSAKNRQDAWKKLRSELADRLTYIEDSSLRYNCIRLRAMQQAVEEAKEEKK